MPRPKAPKMQKKAPVEFTIERKQRFLDRLREHGLQYVAAAEVGVDPRTVQDHKTRDTEFAAAYSEALNYHTDHVLVREMMRRAVEGVRKPIIGGKDRDQIVTYVQEHSDTLMMAMMRARRVEFNKGAEEGNGFGGPAGGGGSGGGVLIVPAAALTREEWEARYGEAAKGTTGMPT